MFVDIQHQDYYVAPFTLNQTEQILKIQVPWPKCNYSLNSRRNKPSASKLFIKSTIDQILQCVDGWNKFNEISIDGMNASGKSTLINSLTRQYVKINEHFPHVTSGANYNYDPIRSMEYLMGSLLITGENLCWDRCPYSNLIFYYAHHLMGVYADRKIPMDYNEILPIFNNLALSTCLIDTIAYGKLTKNIPILFIVCSDLDILGQALLERGINTKSQNDVYNSKNLNYQIAQYHAYVYFASVLNCGIIDLDDVFKLNYSVADLHTLLSEKLNMPNRVKSDYLLHELDKFGAENAAAMRTDFNDDVLMIEKSCK